MREFIIERNAGSFLLLDFCCGHSKQGLSPGGMGREKDFRRQRISVP